MSPDLQWARDAVVSELNSNSLLFMPWAFEFTPAGSERPDKTYLDKVRQADIVIWLVGDCTTAPVRNEINEALALNSRLFVFMLPEYEQDSETQNLVKVVGKAAKWTHVHERADLRRLLSLSLVDEIVRAIRRKPGHSRLARLEEIGRASRARCIAKWQAAGISYDLATSMTDDLSIGSFPSLELPPRVAVLIGDVGAGKSLRAERVLQSAIQRARDSADSPLPVFLEASTLKKPLAEEVETLCEGIGVPATAGACVVVDAADESQADMIVRLLYEARVLTGAWPNTQVLITSRPHPALDQIEEAVQAPLLTNEHVTALVERITGRRLSVGDWYGLSASLKEAIQRPLFAILLANHLQATQGRFVGSTDGLISMLVQRSLGPHDEHRRKSVPLLRRLAALSLGRDSGWVPLAELGTDMVEEVLQRSRLVILHESQAKFALHILAEWFGAQAIIADDVTINIILQEPRKLHIWRSSICMALKLVPSERSHSIISLLADKEPGFCAGLITEVYDRHREQPEIPLPDTDTCGNLLVETMGIWVKSLGPFAKAIAPLRNDGRLRQLGISTTSSSITLAWASNLYPTSDEAFVHIDEEDMQELFKGPWSELTSHYMLSASTGWNWHFMLKHLRDRLKKAIDKRAFYVRGGALENERIWQIALNLSREYSSHHNGIPFVRLKQRLSELSPRTSLHAKFVTEPEDHMLLSEYVDKALCLGQTELWPPWPGLDLVVTEPRVWNRYTLNVIYERTQSIYAVALDEYQTLVKTYFSNLEHWMPYAALFPVKLRGYLYMEKDNPSYDGPVLEWYFEPIPLSQRNSVNIMLADSPNRSKYRQVLGNIAEAAKTFRPDFLPAINPSYHSGMLRQVFRASPVTEIVYDWLQSDLRAIKWIE